MRFYCVELNWNFNSVRLAYILEDLGLTVIRRDFVVAVAFQLPQTARKNKNFFKKRIDIFRNCCYNVFTR